MTPTIQAAQEALWRVLEALAQDEADKGDRRALNVLRRLRERVAAGERKPTHQDDGN